MDAEERTALVLAFIGVAWLVILTVLFIYGATVTVDGHHYTVKLGG